MRFRVRRKGRAGHISVPEKPEKKVAPLKAADLDNQCRRGRFGCNLFALTAPDLKYSPPSKGEALVVSSSGLWYTY